MTVDLVTVNLVLDVIIKLLFLGILVYLVMFLRNLDKLVKSVERSAESIEKSADRFGKMMTVSKWLPMIGKKLKKGEEDGE